jgi:hypothetical protein
MGPFPFGRVKYLNSYRSGTKHDCFGLMDPNPADFMIGPTVQPYIKLHGAENRLAARGRHVPVEQPRRFPAPWDIEEHNRSCFIVRDNNGQALAYVYFETEPGRRTAANLLTRDEARRIAANIARLPELLGAEPKPDANPLVHRRPA